MYEKIRDDRQMRALTGVSLRKFAELLPTFSKTYQQQQHKAYEAGLAQGTRKRKPGGGQKGKLPQMEDKLYFILSYYKTYPTFDELGVRFDLSRSKANEWVHRLSPVLQQTLQVLGHLPQREFESVAAFRQALGEIGELLLDVTERPHQRPGDEQEQQELYSGKKKRHTVQNLIISTFDKVIVFVSQTYEGRKHDYAILKEAFPPEFPWFEYFILLADLGFQGIQTDYVGDSIFIPFKKPRKCKANPDPKLTQAQKAVNKALAQVRVRVEHAIAGCKRFNILSHPFRNHKHGFDDQAMIVSAGLWNFCIS